MADFRRVSADYAVAPQLTVEDVASAKAAGFQTIVCNRPDGEAPGQDPMDAIEGAATAVGLAFRRIPIGGPPTPAAVAETQEAIGSGAGPILAYCRSGTRSVTLWALATAKAGAMPVADILKAAQAAGYDLSAQAGALERLRPGGEPGG